MKISARWLNDYLDPPLDVDVQAECLTRAGFPVEARELVQLPSGSSDVRLDIELTSNRGDCLSHVGLAREVAAVSGSKFTWRSPVFTTSPMTASSLVAVENRDHGRCPLYTAHIIKGVQVGPSPAWLAERLIARGDTPRNNIVDASNFVLYELGQPTHVFDLDTLRGGRIIIRSATAGEPFLPLGEGASVLTLHPDDLVIADAERAVAIAGVKGGAATALTNTSRNILIEAASFAPAAVRASSRRHRIPSDAAYRFERSVHPGQIDAAADRLIELLLQVCGGEACAGVVSDGVPIPPKRTIELRCDRCRAVIGLPIPDQRMCELLACLDLKPVLDRGRIRCEIPHQRCDLEREVDLIEEVARLHGLDHLHVSETISVRVAPPQATEQAKRAVNDAMVGMGYVETVTHSLVSEQAAKAFIPSGMIPMKIEDERAGAEPVLRPSILPSLLRVYAHNRDNGNPDVRLFETASVFGLMGDKHIERVMLAMIAPTGDQGLREIRGVIDRLVQVVLGDQNEVIAESQRVVPWFCPGAVVRVGDEVLGFFGVIALSAIRAVGVDASVVGAEIELTKYYERYPPSVEARPLPAFPAIERDISAIVDETVAWNAVRQAIDGLRLPHVESVQFVTTFRGKQVGSGRKSLTLRLRFRAPDRTLVHEEIDPQVQRVMDMLKASFGGVIRA